MSEQLIQCPACHTNINVEAILYQKLKNDFDLKISAQEKKHMESIRQIEEREKNIGNLIDEGVSKKISSEKKIMEEKIRLQISEEKSGEIESYKLQLDEKIKEAKEFNKMKADYLKLEREKNEQKELIEAEAQKTINEMIKIEKEKIVKSNEMLLNDKDHMINNLLEKLKDAQKKIEQGSMQSQGEVQELAIELYLKSKFPLDNIDEIKKGSKGADCLQIINTHEKQLVGNIYYESKRTKDFQNSWIEKFKGDMREKNATFGVLVTEAYPKGIDRMTQIEGIWVCSFDEFKGLCFVLRQSVILLSSAHDTHENKGGKMEMLYSYLTGSEFRSQVEAIVEGFTQMNHDLTSEKKAILGIWKKREKQILKLTINTTEMYSSIKGIGGNAIGNIKALELPELEN